MDVTTFMTVVLAASEETNLPNITYQVTVTAGQSTTPKFTFGSGGTPGTITWGDGTADSNVVSGVELTHEYSAAGTYIVTLNSPNQATYLTAIDIRSDYITKVLSYPQNYPLTLFYLAFNANLVQDISRWRLPATLQYFNIGSTAVFGDVSAWTLPAGLINFYTDNCRITGNVSAWVLPATLAVFNCGVVLGYPCLTGDISGWVLPDPMINFSIYNTTLSGNITTWGDDFPAGLEVFMVYHTNMTGNIGSWVWPATIKDINVPMCNFTGDITHWFDGGMPAAMFNFDVSVTSCTGSVADWPLPASLWWFYINSSGVTGCPAFAACSLLRHVVTVNSAHNEATVDLYLSRLLARKASLADLVRVTLDGNNASPSAQGWDDADALRTAGVTLVEISGTDPRAGTVLSFVEGAGGSKDTYFRSSAPTTNYGTDGTIRIGNTGAYISRTLIQFDLTDLPANAIISSAILSVFGAAEASSNATTMSVYRCKRAWVEAEATWNIYSAGNNWQTAGGFGADDCEQTPIGSASLSATETMGFFEDITLTPTSKADLDLGNGWMLKTEAETADQYQFFSSDTATAPYRPKLVITYTLP